MLRDQWRGRDHLEVLLSLAYRLVRCLVGLLAVLVRSDLSKDTELLVQHRLYHQEVAGDDRVRLGGQELPPARAAGRWIDARSALRLRGVVIFVDHSRDGGFSADGSQVGHIPDRLRLHIRGPLLPGLVRPAAVVMGHVLAEHQGQVALTEDQDPVQQLRPRNSIFERHTFTNAGSLQDAEPQVHAA